MYGLIFENLSQYVTSVYGAERWEEIRRRSRIDLATFSTHEVYPDNFVHKLVSKACKLGGTIFKVNAHVRHPDDVCRGVIYGLLPGTSSAEIVAGLRVDPRYTVLGARMLGQSSTAVITFDGPHVPYYITYQSGDYHCKPYHNCDEFPEVNNPPTASGSPPQGQPGSSSPIRRSRSRSRTRSRSRSRSRSVQRISYADAAQGDSKSHHKHTLVSPAETTAVKALENRVLDQQKMLQSHRDKIQSEGAIVDKLAKLCKEQEEIIKKQNENIEKLTRLFQEQLLSKQPAPNHMKEEIEAVVEAKIVSVIETKLAALVGSHLTTLVEPKSTAIVESRLEAFVDTKLEPVTIQIGNTFTTLNCAMDTRTAQINELKSQLTNFIAHVKNNCISHADLENLPGRKKPRTQSKKASRSNSPERENNDPVDGSS
ncbi:hypothetical protein HPB50_006879 [Hyalomma asiaticum]|uniref:Uncharacterized protein n=1 Tax=Hyalomma asiaticum TaxID=266040 RepID=A0ACB7SP75_HYAAI|nr:hypothetical protein HPB50_006879 [Hyalomma asiaticum]